MDFQNKEIKENGAKIDEKNSLILKEIDQVKLEREKLMQLNESLEKRIQKSVEKMKQIELDRNEVLRRDQEVERQCKTIQNELSEVDTGFTDIIGEGLRSKG